MTNPRDSFTHLAHLEKLMLSFLLFLFVSGGPPSPFPALLLLFLGAIMKHGDMRDGVMRGKKSSGLPATRREQGRAVRLCARMCVYTPSFPHPSSRASPLAHSHALNCEDIMWCIELFSGPKSVLERMQQL